MQIFFLQTIIFNNNLTFGTVIVIDLTNEIINHSNKYFYEKVRM